MSNLSTIVVDNGLTDELRTEWGGGLILESVIYLIGCRKSRYNVQKQKP